MSQQANRVSTPTTDPTAILEAVRQLRAGNPRLRVRDIAAHIGITEAQLVAAGCGTTATRLNDRFGDFLLALPELGPVMILTRNESAVHEKRGTFANVSVDGQIGLVVDEDIDLRVFFFGWASVFAVSEETRDGTRRSLQVFDAYGDSVHKIFLEDNGNVDAYDRLVETFRDDDQSPTLSVKPVPAAKAIRPDSEIDVGALREAWLGLKDTHDFFPMLKKLNVDRLQALRLAGDDLAKPVTLDSPRRVLEGAAKTGLPIMVFVGSRGVIQIHTGPIETVRPVGPWINVLDHGFNLHLREDRVASAWLVRKPTTDGTVTALEIFDADGENIALFFGKRKPGIPESNEWREFAESLPALDAEIA